MSSYLLGELFLYAIFVNLACLIVTGEVARSKGHSGFGWSVAALFLGPFALLAAIGLGDRKLQVTMREMLRLQQGEAPERQHMEEMREAGLQEPTPQEKAASRRFGWMVSIVVALIFVLFMLRGFSR